MSETDRIRRFLLEHHPVRGHVVQLEGAWQRMREHTTYPAPVRDLLGQATCAAVLLASTLKFQGTLTLQLQGDGAVRLLVAQCTHDFRVRSVARFDDTRPLDNFRALVGTGRITVTVESDERAARYQGIVPLSGDSLEQCIDEYFATSEQLPTQVRLAADDTRAGGMLMQRVPGLGGHGGSLDPEAADKAWDAASAQLELLDDQELLHVNPEALLRRSATVDDVRLFDGDEVKFECRCDRERVATILRGLGQEEVEDVVREQGKVTVTCEFCQKPYDFDPIDVAQLFAEQPPPPAPGPSRPN